MTALPSREILVRHELRATTGRVRILNVLRRASVPLTAAELHARLGREAPDIVTVYRTLERFAAASLARSVRLADGLRRYENAEGGHHHHLVCTGCGAVEDLLRCEVFSLEEQALREHGFRVKRHALEFYGTCRACAGRPA